MAALASELLSWPDSAASRAHTFEANATESSCVPRALPIGSMVAPFGGSHIGSYKVIPKRNYNGTHGYMGPEVAGPLQVKPN